MSQKKNNSQGSIVREIKRNTRRTFNAEEKIRIILEGLRGETASSRTQSEEQSLKKKYNGFGIRLGCYMIVIFF